MVSVAFMRRTCALRTGWHRRTIGPVMPLSEPFFECVMLYETLVSRVSELSRALVQSGSEGEFEQGSSVFRAEGDFSTTTRPGFWLKILEGSAQGTYRILSILRSNEVEVERRFEFGDTGVAWEVYDRGVEDQDIRKVLHVLPDVVMECEEGEQVRTPLGVFKVVRRKSKRVRCPSGVWTQAPERIQARIRPGKRLQRPIEEPASERRTEDYLTLVPDEDPEN